MIECEWKILADHRTNRKMYCEDYVDKKWAKTMERRNKELHSLEKKREAQFQLQCDAE